MGEYYRNVHFSPLDRSIGRLEGEHRCLEKFKKMFDEKKKRKK